MMKKARRYRKVPIKKRLPSFLLHVFVVGLVLFLCALSVYSLAGTMQVRNTDEAGSSSVAESSEATSSIPEAVSSSPPEKVPPATITILGVGDNLIHDGIYKQAAKRAGGKGYDFSPVYQHVAPYIQEVDVAVINQETPLAGDVLPPSGYPRFNSPTEVGDELIKIGFDVINHANNHILDKGEQGVKATLEYWKSKSIPVVGAYQSDADMENIRLVEVNGIKTAHIGVTEMTNGLQLPKDTPYHILLTSETELLESMITKAKSMADVVVVSVHWGNEYTHKPTQKQTDLAQQMVDWGADIIFGNHAHTLQPLTVLKRADGTECPVVYALGNFVSAQADGLNMVAGMLRVTMTKDFETGKTVFTDMHFEPIVTHYGKNFQNITIYPLSAYTEELASSHGVKANTPNFSLSYIQNIVDHNIPKKYLTND